MEDTDQLDIGVFSSVYYRPQTKFAKVKFYRCLSVGGGGARVWRGRWACVAGGCAWQGVCMAAGACMAGGHARWEVGVHVWQGACMAGRVCVAGEACVAGGCMHATHTPTRYYEIW